MKAWKDVELCKISGISFLDNGSSSFCILGGQDFWMGENMASPSSPLLLDVADIVFLNCFQHLLDGMSDCRCLANCKIMHKYILLQP